MLHSYVTDMAAHVTPTIPIPKIADTELHLFKPLLLAPHLSWANWGRYWGCSSGSHMSRNDTAGAFRACEVPQTYCEASNELRRGWSQLFVDWRRLEQLRRISERSFVVKIIYRNDSFIFIYLIPYLIRHNKWTLLYLSTFKLLLPCHQRSSWWLFIDAI